MIRRDVVDEEEWSGWFRVAVRATLTIVNLVEAMVYQ